MAFKHEVCKGRRGSGCSENRNANQALQDVGPWQPHVVGGDPFQPGGYFEFWGCTPRPPTSHGAPLTTMALNFYLARPLQIGSQQNSQVIVKWLPCPVVSCCIALYHGHQQTQEVMQRRDTGRYGGIRLALPSGSSARKGVRVQIPPSAPPFLRSSMSFMCCAAPDLFLTQAM
jgi:hypothetical protein